MKKLLLVSLVFSSLVGVAQAKIATCTGSEEISEGYQDATIEIYSFSKDNVHLKTANLHQNVEGEHEDYVDMKEVTVPADANYKPRVEKYKNMTRYELESDWNNVYLLLPSKSKAKTFTGYLMQSGHMSGPTIKLKCTR